MEYVPPEPNYRPLSAPEHHFNTLVGHETVKKMLWKMVRADRLPNALLFRGPEGVGKRSMAFALAKLINGEPGDISDAAPSRAARNIATGNYLDLRVIQHRGAAGQILIEDIRDATDWTYLSPVEARKKIILICEAERMNVASANCFLKALEEPPEDCLIVLTTAMPHALLPTIRSRCAAVFMLPVPSDQLSLWLKSFFTMSDEQASIAALLGEGRPGQALAQLVKIEGGDEEGEEVDLWSQVAQGEGAQTYGVSAEARRATAMLMDRFYQLGFAATFGVAHGLLATSEGNLRATLTLLLTWYRDLTLRSAAGNDSPLAVNRDVIAKVKTPHTPSNAAVLGRSLRAVIEALGDARRPSINPQLAVENLLLRLGEINRNAQ